MYVKGKDNVIADALYKVSMTLNELKDMKETSLAITTRGQKRREEESRMNEQTVPINTTDNWPDQPIIVELLREPCDSIEMKLVEERIIKKFKKENRIEKENDCFVYIPSKMLLC